MPERPELTVHLDRIERKAGAAPLLGRRIGSPRPAEPGADRFATAGRRHWKRRRCAVVGEA